MSHYKKNETLELLVQKKIKFYKRWTIFTHTHTHTRTHTHTHTHIYIYIYVCIYTRNLHTSRMRHKVNSKWSLTGLNTEFSFSNIGCNSKVKESSLVFYLFILERETVGVIHFPRVLALCATQTTSSRIWSIYIYIYMCVCVCVYEHVWLNNKDTFCLYNFIRILSSFLASVLGFSWSRLMNLPKLSRKLSGLYVIFAMVWKIRN